MARRRIRLPLLSRPVRWSLVGVVSAAILVASVVRPPDADPVPGPFGLVPRSMWLHGIAYAGLAVVLAYALLTSPRPDWQVLCAVFALATAYGLGIELLQSTIAYRSFEVADILVNAGGAALAVMGWKLLLGHVRFYRCRRLAALRPPVG